LAKSALKSIRFLQSRLFRKSWPATAFAATPGAAELEHELPLSARKQPV
jgi:hypothetical protein